MAWYSATHSRTRSRIYFNPIGGKPGIRHPDGVDIDHKEFPEDWFQGLEEQYYLSRRYLAVRNKYGVRVCASL